MTTTTTNDGRRGIPWRLIGWGGAAALLLIPVIGGAPWTPLDYVFAVVMIGLVGLALELAVRASASSANRAAYRTAAGLAVAASFLLVWINAAVGIIGSENDDANMLFLGVVAAALGGSLLARFRPAGMAWAMAAAALCQFMVPVAAGVLALAPLSALGAREVPVLTLFFTGMWLLSAWLFRRAGRVG